MIAVDTNVLLRYILNDDEAQFALASSFFKARTVQNPAFVGLIVLCEMAWSLRRRYGFSREQVRSVVMRLFETAEVQIEAEAEISPLVSGADMKADIADLLISHCAGRSGCAATVTLDRRAAARIPGMELLA